MRTVRELRLAGLFAYLASLVIALLLSLALHLLLGGQGELGWEGFNAYGLLEGLLFLPVTELNRMRRGLVELLAQLGPEAGAPDPRTPTPATEHLDVSTCLQQLAAVTGDELPALEEDGASPPDLIVLVRHLDQLRALRDQPVAAVIADLVDITRLHTADPLNRVPHLAFQPGSLSNLTVLPMSDVVTSYYLRLRVADQAGVLAKLTGLLAQADISIDAVLQREADQVSQAGENQTDVIILTHDTREGTLNEVLVQMQYGEVSLHLQEAGLVEEQTKLLCLRFLNIINLNMAKWFL